MPGAVNVHAHLGFRRKDAPEGGTFSGWLSRLIERLPEKETWTAEAARDCAQEAIEAGTTFMAESSPYAECLPQLAESGMAGTAYAEFFPHELGTPEEAVEHVFGKVRESREGLPPRVGAHVSVHSPYTVDPRSSELAALKARGEGGRLAIHLSESPEEVEFVEHGAGGLTDIFGSNDWGGTGMRPVEYARKVALLGPETIAAHLATGVTDEDLEILRNTDTGVAHCPHSNELLGCGAWPACRRCWGAVFGSAWGPTGSGAAPGMNLFGETLFAMELHGFDGGVGLRLATLGGAEALGIGEETGKPGAR